MRQSDLHIAMHQQLLEQAVAAERGRCLRIIEKLCVEMAREESKKMHQARREGRPEAEMFYSHGSWAASELGDRIYKEINGASMEDPIADETERCARICADRAERLAATAEQYPAGTAACFAAEARECERLIRGEG